MNICATSSTFMFWMFISYAVPSQYIRTINGMTVKTNLEALVHNNDGLVEFFLYFISYLPSTGSERSDLHTTLVMMRDSRRFCWCSCGLSCAHRQRMIYFLDAQTTPSASEDFTIFKLVRGMINVVDH